MKKNIPYISRSGATEFDTWLQILNTTMPEYNFKALEHFTDADRNRCEVAIVADPDPALLQSLPNLKWIQSTWAGVDKIIAELKGSAIKIVRMTDPQLALSMAEAVLAWTLYLHRDMPAYRQYQEMKIWNPLDVLAASQRTIGVLGLGNLGVLSCKKLAEQGFQVIGWSRTKISLDNVETYAGKETLKTVMEQSDILIVLLPLTHETHHLLNSKTLAHLPSNASIINFARGAIVEDIALLSNLDNKKIKHAVLDVFDSEPLSNTNSYWNHPSVTVLPHISAPTNRLTASKIVAENLRNFFNNGTIPKSVDWKRGY